MMAVDLPRYLLPGIMEHLDASGLDTLIRVSPAARHTASSRWFQDRWTARHFIRLLADPSHLLFTTSATPDATKLDAVLLIGWCTAAGNSTAVHAFWHRCSVRRKKALLGELAAAGLHRVALGLALEEKAADDREGRVAAGVYYRHLKGVVEEAG